MELGWGPIQGVQGALWSWESFQTLLKQCAFSCDWSRCSGGITSYLLERKPIQQLALLLLNSEALKSGIQIIHRVHIHLSEVQLPHKTKKEKYPGLSFVRNVTFLYLSHTFFSLAFFHFSIHLSKAYSLSTYLETYTVPEIRQSPQSQSSWISVGVRNRRLTVHRKRSKRWGGRY